MSVKKLFYRKTSTTKMAINALSALMTSAHLERLVLALSEILDACSSDAFSLVAFRLVARLVASLVAK